MTRLASIIAALAFSCPAVAGQTTLTWTAPTQNTDGTPLINLIGYWMYAGCVRSGQYELPRQYIEAPAESFVFAPLPEGATCYFTATSVKATGVKSGRSNEAIKEIEITTEKPCAVMNLVVSWEESPPPPASIYSLPTTDFTGTPVEAGTFNVSPGELDIAFAINPRSFPDRWPRIISKAIGTAEQSHVFMVSLQDGRPRFRIKTDGNTSTLLGNSSIPFNRLTTGRVVYDSSTMQIWVNGLLDASVAKTGLIDQTSQQAWVGGNPPNNASPLDGTIAVTVK